MVVAGKCISTGRGGHGASIRIANHIDSCVNFSEVEACQCLKFCRFARFDHKINFAAPERRCLTHASAHGFSHELVGSVLI